MSRCLDRIPNWTPRQMANALAVTFLLGLALALAVYALGTCPVRAVRDGASWLLEVTGRE